MSCPRQTLLVAAALSFVLPSLGFAQEDPSLERLNASPRHHEWVKVTHGKRTVHTFVVYPEVEGKVPAVLLIHENRGLTDWVRAVADRLAENGYVALAPDLLSGMGPKGGKTGDFADSDAARDAIYKLAADQVEADLQAVADYAKGLPAVGGKLYVAGFCWGGGRSFEFATQRPDLAAAFVFYGTPPEDDAALARISCPVYGFYGRADERVTGTVEATVERMHDAGKAFVPTIYDGAGHGFLRAGESPDASRENRLAAAAGWDRWLEILADVPQLVGE